LNLLREVFNATPQFAQQVILPAVTLDNDIARVSAGSKRGEHWKQWQIPLVEWTMSAL
jgi:hypothetical protein